MKREEAIKRIRDHMDLHRIGDYPHINLREALNMAISALREQEERRWIPVTERLPEKNNRWVLCLCVSGAMEVLKFDYTMRDWDAQYPGRCYMENYVTHWMPLPEPSKEGDNAKMQ